MGSKPEHEPGNMPIKERSEDDRPKGPMSPPDDSNKEPGKGAVPIKDREEDDRPTGPISG